MSALPALTARPDRDYEPPFLASGFTLLVAARIPAWFIALAVVIVDARPEPNLRHEPQLLVLSLVQIIVLMAYTPLVRPLLRRWSGKPLRGRRDLLALSAFDLIGAFAIVFASGGLNTPYYHFAVVALLVPTFLLGWRGSIAVLAVFLVGIVGTWEYAGLGHAFWTSRANLGGSVPGLVLTPVLVVLVAQYLGWLARRIETARLETVASLDRTAALHRISQGLALPERERAEGGADLGAMVASALRETGRFDEFVVLRLSAVEVLRRDLDPAEGELLLVRRGAAPDELLAIPFGERGPDQCALGFRGVALPTGSADVQVVRAAARQLTLALSRLALEAEREVLVAAEERARIAREIHDGIAQAIYMLSLQLDRITTEAPVGSRLESRLEGLAALSKEALVDVRQYIFDLKPLLNGEQSLAQTVERQAEEFSTVAEVPVAVLVRGHEPPLPVSLRTALYRVAQEGLANAVRHAQASQIELHLTFAAEHVRLEVTDDGVGFDPAEGPSGHGLGNIRMRVEECGGTCRVESTPARGTTIWVDVPLVNGT